MTEIQMEELKATIYMVGIAGASDWVFRALLLMLELCSLCLLMILKMRQRMDAKDSNSNSLTTKGG